MSEPTLQHLPEDWDRALAIVAHPDDMEYGAASAVARWTRQGKTVAYVLVTRGETGIDSLPPDECALVREAEERASAEVVGVSTVDFLGHPDGLVEYGVPLRRDLTAAIRRHRPEVIVGLNHHDTWGGRSLNMADHRNTGLAVLDAVRDASNPWVFPDAGEAWKGVRMVCESGSPEVTHAVDVTDTIDLGVASLEAHRAYLAHVGGDTEFLRSYAEQTGARLGTRYATSFEVFEF
jgi:LmbE family N-acetylglucosaminyl deacetylase